MDNLGGVVPSLQLLPLGNASTTLIMSIRGNGPTDISQITREGGVAVYLDGFYMSHAQGYGDGTGGSGPDRGLEGTSGNSVWT